MILVFISVIIQHDMDVTCNNFTAKPNLTMDAVA